MRASGAKKSQVEKVKWMKHERLTLMGIFQCSNLSLIDHFFQDSDQLYQAQDLQAYFGTSFEEFDGLVVSESIFEIGGKFFSISFIIVYFFRAVKGCVITQSRVSP